ncbi:hypothetical protein D9M69_551580 [compost metagenome]
MALGDARRESGRAMEKARRAIGQNNEKARRAIGQNNEKARRAIGQANEDARRGIGDAMEIARRGESLQRDLNSLETAPRKRQALSRLEQRGARPAMRGRGTVNLVPATGGGGGGIASPLTEPSFADREYWSSGFPSSDGLFILPAIKTLKLLDADDDEVVINLADPEAEE